MFAGLIEELMGLDEAAMVERFRELELRRRRDEAELAAVIAVVEVRQLWATDGNLSIKGWLRANANWSNADVGRQRRAARLCNDHPSVGDALLDGHIGVAQVHEMAKARANGRCGNELGRVVDQLTEHAEQLPFEDFRTVVRRWESLADADGAHRDAARSHEQRTASITEFDGGVELRASGGSPLTTAAIMTIFDRFVEAEFRADVEERTRLHGPDAPSSLLARTAAQRSFDALVAIFEQAASMPSDARRPEPVVNIVVSQERFETELFRHHLIDAIDGPYVDPLDDLLRQRCETANGVTVPGDEVLRAAIAGHVCRVVIDSKERVINYGRRTRLFTGAAREAIKLVARSCDHLGCDIGSGSCQIDHIEEWARDGGRTDSANGRPKCHGHNRRKHRLGLTERIDRNGSVVQFRSDGSPMLPVGRRLLPDASDVGDGRDPADAVHGWPVRRISLAA
jgi:hypothetical protein